MISTHHSEFTPSSNHQSIHCGDDKLADISPSKYSPKLCFKVILVLDMPSIEVTSTPYNPDMLDKFAANELN